MSWADVGDTTLFYTMRGRMSISAQRDLVHLVREQIIANRKELAEQERLLDEIADRAPFEVRVLKTRLAIAKQHQAQIETIFGQASCNDENIIELKHYKSDINGRDCCVTL